MSDWSDERLNNVTQSESVDSADNTDGVAVVLPAGGRPFVNIYYSVTASAQIAIEGRYSLGNGSETDWVTLDTIDTSESDTPDEDTAQFPWQSYDEIRMTTSTTDVGVKFIISAGR